MPIYEYECEACRDRFEVIQKFSDAPAATCAKCGKGPIRRLLSSPAIQFKGSGWYITDYAQKGKSDSASTPADKTEKTGAAEKTQTKTGTKTETTSAAATTSSTPASKDKS